MNIPKPVQKPYSPMLLPVDSQESFEPMGTHGYRIAIGGGTSPHNLRGYTVLKDDVKHYRKAWQAAGHPGEPTTVVRMPTLVAETQAEAQRLTENLMRLARRYYAGRAGIGSTDGGSASPRPLQTPTCLGRRRWWWKAFTFSGTLSAPTRSCSRSTGRPRCRGMW